jgi:hypothetical protein
MKNVNYTYEQKEVAYNYFKEKKDQGLLIDGFKDAFLSHRQQWDDLQKLLNEGGTNNFLHDDVKGLVRCLDKSGYLGGLSDGQTFKERDCLLQLKRENQREFGNPDGVQGILENISEWSGKANSPLDDYYRTMGWQARSLDYRRRKGWICELCLKDHSSSHHTLHTHHRTYKLADGSSAIGNETDRELMALCDSPCHKMADVARMIREGNFSPIAVKTLELFELGRLAVNKP